VTNFLARAPAHVASLQAHWCEYMHVLVFQYGANVKVVDHEGRNALWYARTSGSVECTDLLTSNGCPDTATLPRRRGSSQPSSKNDVFDKLPASVI
jgi:Arf-GAP/GTPase/ANK repeat/PH domain-containing protein 1/3